jgi:hypothetical protein
LVAGDGCLREGKFPWLLVMKTSFFALLCLAILVSCAPGPAVFQFYVVIKPGETGKFIGTITSLAKESSLVTAVGQTISDTGNVTRVVEGRGDGVRFWLQNAPLSGREDPKLCGVHHEPYSDSAQFVVFTTPRFGFESTRTAAVKLGEKMFSKLQESGFDVRRRPAVCGAAAYPP